MDSGGSDVKVHERLIELNRLVRRLRLNILVPEEQATGGGPIGLLAAPSELERLLDLVAAGEEEFRRLGWTLKADPVDIGGGSGQADWVVEIVIDVPVSGLDELIRRLSRHLDEGVDQLPAVLVGGSTAVH